MRNIRLPAVVWSLAILGLVTSASAQFTENFDDGNASTRWTAPVVDAENGLFDGTVDFAFDYGSLGIPVAPGGGSTTGLFFEAMADQKRPFFLFQFEPDLLNQSRNSVTWVLLILESL